MMAMPSEPAPTGIVEWTTGQLVRRVEVGLRVVSPGRALRERVVMTDKVARLAVHHVQPAAGHIDDRRRRALQHRLAAVARDCVARLGVA